jgi:hypothetical protein
MVHNRRPGLIPFCSIPSWNHRVRQVRHRQLHRGPDRAAMVRCDWQSGHRTTEDSPPHAPRVLETVLHAQTAPPPGAPSAVAGPGALRGGVSGPGEAHCPITGRWCLRPIVCFGYVKSLGRHRKIGAGLSSDGDRATLCRAAPSFIISSSAPEAMVTSTGSNALSVRASITAPEGGLSVIPVGSVVGGVVPLVVGSSPQADPIRTIAARSAAMRAILMLDSFLLGMAERPPFRKNGNPAEG